VVGALLALVLASGPLAAVTDDEQPRRNHFSSEVAWTWFDKLYDVVKSEATPPPPASRIYGMASIALYEAVVPGTRFDRSLVGQLNGLSGVPHPHKNKDYHWPTVANAALAETIRGIFSSLKPENLEAINALEASFNARFRPRLGKKEFERSVEQGKAVGDAILAWAATDGFAIFNACPYIPAAVPGAWKPTPPAFAPNPLQPCWGQLRPMVLTSGDECPPQGHPSFSTDAGSAFYAAALEVYNVGLGLTHEQKTIARYWADSPGVTGTPPGHWVAIVAQIARNDRLSLGVAAEAFARLGIAITDAFIACWNVKYATNLQRPVTFIQENINATWMPFIVTPAFPTYTSGHSMQSGAAARVLTDMFGRKRFTDTLHMDHQLVPLQTPRTFVSFDQAAREAALSRLYGGIHYRFDDNDGLGCGQCIGRAIRERVRFREDPDSRR
jgi:hypothetical protein